MSQTAIISLIPVISVVLGAMVVAFDIWTNPHNVAERAHKRNAQMRFNEPTQFWAMKTARNIHRHRRIY